MQRTGTGPLPAPSSSSTSAKRVAAVGNGGDHLGHHLLPVVEKGPAVALGLGQAVVGDHLPQPPFAGAVGGELGGEVPLALGRSAHIGQQQAQQLTVELPAAHDLHRRDAQPLLEDLGGEGERARGHAADIGMVGAVGDEEGGALPPEKDRRHQGDVGQVGPSAIGVVEKDRVAGREVRALQGRRHRQGHRSEMHRDVGGLGHHPPLPVEEGAGEVPPLLDVGGEGGAHQHRPHFLGEGDEAVLDHFQTDGVYSLQDQNPLKGNFDGVAKTHQLLRCCNCSRWFDVPKYASLLDNCAPCIWRFLLSHPLFCFLAKASILNA